MAILVIRKHVKSIDVSFSTTEKSTDDLSFINCKVYRIVYFCENNINQI
jgi:hypothetical protein